MSDNASTADPSDPFTGLWAVWVEQADARNKALFEGLRDIGEPKQLQKLWLEALSKAIDSYLRSPAFLEAMRRNLEAMTDLKVFQDRMAEDVARHVDRALAGNIVGFFERLPGVDPAILARLKAIAGSHATTETKQGSEQDPP